MKKRLLLIFICFVINLTQVLYAQNKGTNINKANRFDEKAAYEEAKAKGVQATEINGYVQFLKHDFSSKKALEKQSHKHTPYEGGTGNIQETVIYLEPNKPMSVGCPNMGFEQYDFSNWTGGKGTTYTVSGGTSPSYSVTGNSIINTAGNNVSLLNTTNYQTIMTIPPTNKLYPVCSGYDSLAVRAVGSSTVCDIPFISPFSFDAVSVRLNSANANNRAARLKYVTTTSSNNQRLSFSYAVILNDPASHAAVESPYFKVSVKNETTGNILTGCTSYTFNPKTATASDSLKTSALSIYGDLIKYRKWQYYSVDLSSLPAGTSVSINFEVGGCTQSGHTGYAYVDAECGGIGNTYANMCSGSNFATLVAPTGFISYQWFGPGGLIAGETNDTLIQSPATPGNTYTVNMISPGGCAITQTVTIGFTTVNIINLNSTSSCAGGNSGSASVLANGSNGIYTYSWTATSGPNAGQTVSTSQTATGLAAGSYSVLVQSTTCGQASANLSVGASPPSYISLSKIFCGNRAIIPQPGGSNYVWYKGSIMIPAPAGTNDTLYIDNPVTGNKYTVVYTSSQGCKDSVTYTLAQIAGGSVYFSNTANVCPSSSNGSTVLNLNTPFLAPYNYLVTGPGSSNITLNTNSSAASLTLSPLAAGVYTTVVNDGVCIYNNTVAINTIQTDFTVTPTHTVLCFPEAAVVDLTYGNLTSTSCGVDPNPCSGTPIQLFTTGTFTYNALDDYPTAYGNYFTYGRHQFLVKKSELNAAGIFAGKISSLAFHVLALNNSATNYPDFSIKMGCSTLTALPNANLINQPFVSGLQTVYSNPNQPIAQGWVTHDFSQAYVWDGNSNIIIEICFSFPDNTGFGNYTENASIELKQMGYTSSLFHVEDFATVCGGTQQADNTLSMLNGSKMLPNMRFGYCPPIVPSSYTVSVSSNGTITTNYGNDSIKVAPAFSTPPSNGEVTYTISITNPIGGCVATKTVSILYPTLTTTVTASATSTTLCQGETSTLSASGAVNYNWYYYQNGILNPISSSYSVNVTPSAIGSNSYIVTGSSTCPGNTPDTKTITVNVIPKANLTVTPIADVTKCLNSSYVIDALAGSSTIGNTGAPYSYLWTTLPGNAPAPGINTVANYTTNSNSTTTLVVTVDGVCANATSDTVVVSNFINNLDVTITSNSLTSCPNKPLTLNSLTTGGYPAFHYFWTVNSATIATTPNLNYTSPASGGTYNVNITVIDSCGYQKTDTEIINVLPNTLNIAIIDSIALCGNTTFSLNSVSNGGYPSYTYQWYLLPNTGNSLSNTQTLSYTTPSSEGLYTIQVMISDSCGYQQSDNQVITVLPPCMVEIPNVITPNGDNANDVFKIKNIEYHPNTSVTIFDRWGLKVYENTNYNNDWKAEGLGDGTYFYVIDVPDDKKYSGFITVFKNK
ncbi:MAG: gliding motility-associated C-terminal domain-containing protein [Bacteroidetes bacterium]|nr:gliding motility-associated C-terminal domain-containing protein [Bacteroidota bacterium]